MMCHKLTKNLIFLLYFLHISKIGLSQYDKNERQLFYQQEWQNMKFSTETKLLIETDTTIDIKFYHIDIGIAIDSAYLAGNVYIKLEPAISNLSTLKLNLHSSLIVDSITMNVTGFSHQNDEISITLDSVYNTGDPVELQIFYHGIPVLANNTKGLRYETHGNGEPVIATLSTPFLAHYWWPCKDGPGDKADSVFVDITIKDTTIGGYQVIALSNGILDTQDSIQGISRTFKWKHRYPVVPYYIMAAISNYRTISQSYTGIFSTFPLIYYVFDANYAAAVTGVSQIPNAMDRLTQLFGDYPFSNEKYGMTELGFYGAIENQTNTIINSINSNWYFTFVHELAHQWFGDMITCSNWHHGWLNEGFATYSEALIAEYLTGPASYKSFMAGAEFYNGGTIYLQTDTNPFNIFQSIIYNKGAYVLHMLRGMLGDVVFFNCLGNYATQPLFKYNHATTEDFRLVCETVSGLNLQDFFDQWIYDEYYPMYAYNFISQPASLAIYQQQNAVNGWRPVFKMPIQVRFHFNTGMDTTVTVLNDQLYQSYTFNFSDSVTSVDIDPENWILKNAVYDPGVIISINDLPDHDGVSVYPNPGHGYFQMEMNKSTPEAMHCQVVDLLGHQVKSIYFKAEEKRKLFILDLTGLPSGIYFLHINFENKHLIKKILLSKK